MDRTRLKLLDKSGLAEWVRSLGEKPFRGRQLWAWMYKKGATSFEEMTDLSKEFRGKLLAAAALDSLKCIRTSESSVSGTKKFLWECPDGRRVESVFIPEGSRRTVCVSSQVGCALACTFCATGRMGFLRNLEAWEIADQVIAARRIVDAPITNVVVMGMGEPFLNYENVLQAMDVLNDPQGLSIGHRRITLSTAGIVPALRRYAEENRPYKLAVSLNAATDAIRSRLMPVNGTYPLSELLSATREYSRRTGRRITFEYVLIRNVNDFRDDAKRLLDLLKGIPCKVNLIPYNAAGGAFERPDDSRVAEFLEWIKPLASPVMVRWSRGVDVDAACGQLAAQNP